MAAHSLADHPTPLCCLTSLHHCLQIIPSLERLFNLVGADLRAWFAAMPRPSKQLPQKRPLSTLPVPAVAPANASTGLGGLKPRAAAASTIDSFYLSKHCAVSYC